jgi:hypothetical protein
VARYFFNIIDGKFLVDEVGCELPNMTAVRAMAIETAGAILRDEGSHLPVGSEWQMYVTDAAKRTVYKLSFSAEEVAPDLVPA